LFRLFLLLFTKSKFFFSYLYFIDDQVKVLDTNTDDANEDFCKFQFISYNLSNLEQTVIFKFMFIIFYLL